MVFTSIRLIIVLSPSICRFWAHLEHDLCCFIDYALKCACSSYSFNNIGSFFKSGMIIFPYLNHIPVVFQVIRQCWIIHLILIIPNVHYSYNTRKETVEVR